jgi:hypothetical protein
MEQATIAYNGAVQKKFPRKNGQKIPHNVEACRRATGLR